MPNGGGRAGRPSTISTRVASGRVEAVRDVLARTANPEEPREVRVSRPSDALAAQRATTSTLGGLILGLAAKRRQIRGQVGGLAGLYPAVRASRLPPTEALATPT
ncbi:hypothetical protein GCM10012284_54910 [Mangrovihabitans endophyticus]|uniref:Uncharacterized protein n=1 Tax=Mangrovihabitans endophyticus TaxID=1751298 RepID=A0A8J3C3Q5_9ACTN|nr:hypothetical protein GCM10012284_54910 [Mangrovihabitans endophyticus]